MRVASHLAHKPLRLSISPRHQLLFASTYRCHLRSRRLAQQRVVVRTAQLLLRCPSDFPQLRHALRSLTLCDTCDKLSEACCIAQSCVSSPTLLETSSSSSQCAAMLGLAEAHGVAPPSPDLLQASFGVLCGVCSVTFASTELPQSSSISRVSASLRPQLQDPYSDNLPPSTPRNNTYAAVTPPMSHSLI